MDCVGMDLHQKFSELCVVDDAGEVVERATVSTTEKALRRWFKRDPMRVAVEASSVSPWVDKLLRELGHEVYVVNPRRVRLIAEATLKTDKVDAETLARLVRIDPQFLSPITHRSEESRQQRAILRVRAVIVETRSKMISVVRGLVKQFGKRIAACSADLFVERFREFADQLDPAVVVAVTPLVEDSDIKRFGERLLGRVGKAKAHVAVARKLAVLMHRLWVTGERYRATSTPPPEPAREAA